MIVDLTLRGSPKATTKLLSLASGGTAAFGLVAGSTAIGFQRLFNNTGEFGCYTQADGTFIENETDRRRAQILGRASTGLAVVSLSRNLLSRSKQTPPRGSLPRDY